MKTKAVRKNAKRITVENRLFDFCGMELGHSDYKIVRAMLMNCLRDGIDAENAKPQFEKQGCKKVFPY